VTLDVNGDVITAVIKIFDN